MRKDNGVVLIFKNITLLDQQRHQKQNLWEFH